MKLFIILFGFILFIRCGEDDQPDISSDPINFIEIGKGTLSGSGLENISPSQMIITNATDWLELKNRMDLANNQSNSFSETDIDFENYMIFAIFFELKPNGWEVEIQEVMENEDNITISIDEVEYETLVITQPYHIIKLPISTKPIVIQ